MYVFTRSAHYSCQIGRKLKFSWQLFENSSNLKFHKTSSSAISCGKTDGQIWLLIAILRTRVIPSLFITEDLTHCKSNTQVYSRFQRIQDAKAGSVKLRIAFSNELILTLACVMAYNRRRDIII